MTWNTNYTESLSCFSFLPVVHFGLSAAAVPIVKLLECLRELERVFHKSSKSSYKSDFEKAMSFLSRVLSCTGLITKMICQKAVFGFLLVTKHMPFWRSNDL